MHCLDKDIAQASDKTSMPLAAVFSEKVKKKIKKKKTKLCNNEKIYFH